MSNLLTPCFIPLSVHFPLNRYNPDTKWGLYINKPDKPLKTVSLVVNNDKQMNNVKHSFQTALKKSGIDHCKLHDLRHTFASHLLVNGASIKDIQELLGHKTMQMAHRYDHLSQEHKKKAVNLLNGLTAQKEKTGKDMSQNVTNPVFDHSMTTPYPVQVADFIGRGERI